MSSSPSRPQTGRNESRRTPLAERTQSQANEISQRLSRPSSRSNMLKDAERHVYTVSPFPTKPAHVLLPSTLRKQKSSQNLVADIFATGAGPLSPSESTDQHRGGRRPQVKLKRSVKTLRDMYEAQADEQSRPGTALSAGQRSSRPGTASSRLRSASSSDGLSGRYAWEQFKNNAADDLALLPSLPELPPTLKPIGSQSSFAVRAAKQAATSSPNYRVHGITSSPKMPVFRDLSEISSEIASEVPTTEPSTVEDGELSPNVIKLGHTSSEEQLPSFDEAQSSPNLIKLASTSPARTLKALAPSSPQRPASSSSSSSLKRKRNASDVGKSFAARAGPAKVFPSSPPRRSSSESLAAPSSPTPVGLQSSPPVTEDPVSSSFDESSPVVRVLNQETSSTEALPVLGSHANLQAVLSSEPGPSSSPGPPIQYPVVRAPASAQMAGLIVPKKKYRNSQTTDAGIPRWPSRQSANNSEISVNRLRSTSDLRSKRSSFVTDDGELDADDLPVAPYILSDSLNNSQIRIIPDSERHEGEDEVTALPGDDFDYRSPPLGPVRGNSYLSNSGSSQSRLNSLHNSFDHRLRSMTSLAPSRHDSLRSRRPDSSSSVMSTLAVPTWARRYYSGFYPDSLRYLAASASNVNLPAQQAPPQPPPKHSRTASLATSHSSRPSFQSISRSISNRITSIVRPRLEARMSHVMPGVGPLVSNPVRGPATTALASQSNQAQNIDRGSTIRPVSFPLHPADPRSQWNGLTEDAAIATHQARQSYPPQAHVRPTSSDCPPSHHQRTIHTYMSRIRSSSPHLHHDHRLNTGSTASRGFGYPFNRKSNRWSAPSIFDLPTAKTTSGSVSNTRRNIQVVCFLTGFAFAPAWFIAAFLPLPPRPDSYIDLEKSHWQYHNYQNTTANGQMTDWEELDILSRLRTEKRNKGREEVAWQNARWWRSLNRWMCIVGVLVVVLVTVLAVVGMRNTW